MLAPHNVLLSMCDQKKSENPWQRHFRAAVPLQLKNKPFRTGLGLHCFALLSPSLFAGTKSAGLAAFLPGEYHNSLVKVVLLGEATECLLASSSRAKQVGDLGLCEDGDNLSESGCPERKIAMSRKAEGTFYHL